MSLQLDTSISAMEDLQSFRKNTYFLAPAFEFVSLVDVNEKYG
jgi:hypothetical protein